MEENKERGKRCLSVCGEGVAQQEQRPRRHTTFKPVLLEVAGFLDDPVCQEVTQRLRQYNNRYAPILRLMLTLVAPEGGGEEEIFGDVGCDEGGTEGLEEGVVEGQGSGERSTTHSKKQRIEPLVTAPCAAVMAEKCITVVHRFRESNGPSPLEKLETFMAYHFLPLALTHNSKMGYLSAERAPFVLRHYVHEATRTASFLVADVVEGKAAVIDPQLDVSLYEADLSLLNLQLVGVVLTHCFVDIAMGHATLLARHPAAVLLSGTPWMPNDMNGIEAPTDESLTLLISPQLRLQCVSLPSFSPECLVVELHLNATLLALFTGTVVGTDALPRHDFFEDYPGLSPSCVVSPVEIARRFLKERLWDKYFASAEDCSGSGPQTLDHVIVFPSHGGYNNTTHQLDLFWAAHIGDLKRMKHARTVLEKVLDADAYSQHIRDRPTLPKSLLALHVREWNMTSLPHAFGRGGASLLTRRSSSPADGDSTADVTPIILDIRNTDEHERAHIMGSINVPMSFPATAYGVKKAELWLQCVLRPLQPIVVICATEEQFPQVRDRLALISPGAPVELFTAKEIQAHSHSTPTTLLGSNTSSYLPHQSVCVINTPASASLRLDNYQKLRFIDAGEDTLVLDCRTPYEFRNGSHKNSVHIPLAELCQMTALDGAEASPSLSSIAASENKVLNANIYGPSSRLGHAFLEKLYESSLAAGIKCKLRCRDVKNIIVYCAGGYRSLIAASLLRRAFEAAEVPIRVSDVVGGALQIMKQRPDLWTVKDRSIICIS